MVIARTPSQRAEFARLTKIEIRDITGDMRDRVFVMANALWFARACIGRMLAQKDVSAYRILAAADLGGEAELSGFLDDLKMRVDRTVARLPSHQTYVGPA